MIVIEPGRSPPPECPTCKGMGEIPNDDDVDAEWPVCPDCGGTGRTPPEVPMTCTTPEF